MILNDFSGVWISDFQVQKKVEDKKARQSLGSLSTMAIVGSELKKTKSIHVPAMIFRIMEVGKTGKFRVEILEECGFYSESIIQKIVNITPDKKNNIAFTFADAKVYSPSSSQYEVLRMGLQIFGLGDVGNMVGNVVINAAQENDLPSNTKTAYQFELQYVDGELKGFCYIIQNYADTKTSQQTQNDVFEIVLKKRSIL